MKGEPFCPEEGDCHLGGESLFMYLPASIGQFLDGKRFKELYCTGFVFGQAGDGSLDFVPRWGVVKLQHLVDEDRLVFHPLRGFV